MDTRVPNPRLVRVFTTAGGGGVRKNKIVARGLRI